MHEAGAVDQLERRRGRIGELGPVVAAGQATDRRIVGRIRAPPGVTA